MKQFTIEVSFDANRIEDGYVFCALSKEFEFSAIGCTSRDAILKLLNQLEDRGRDLLRAHMDSGGKPYSRGDA